MRDRLLAMTPRDSTVLALALVAGSCARGPGPAGPLPPADPATPAPTPTPATPGVAGRWTPRAVDRQHDPFNDSDTTEILRARVDELPQTRRIDFMRDLLVAVGGAPGPDTRVVEAPRPDVATTLAIVWHPVWIVRGCVGRLPGNELFHATTREDASGTVWVLRQDATYRLGRRDWQFAVALVEVEVPCPQDARELIDRPIPRAELPLSFDGGPRLPTYAVREPPTGDDARHFADVDFSQEIVVVGADAPLALPLRLVRPPTGATGSVTAMTYRVPHPILACTKRLPCERAGPGGCVLPYAAQRPDLRPVLMRVANHGQTPVVRWDSGETVPAPDCGQQPGTFVVRAADDPRAPRGVIDYGREMLVGFDGGSLDPATATIVAPAAAAEQADALQLKIAVPIHEVMDVSGCEGAGQRPCDPIARPTGATRVRADWWPVVAGVYYRVPRSNRPISVQFVVPGGAAIGAPASPHIPAIGPPGRR